MESADWKEREGRTLTVVSALRTAASLFGATETEVATKFAMAHLKDDNLSAREAAIQMVGQLMRNAGLRAESATVGPMLSTLLGLAQESKVNVEGVRLLPPSPPPLYLFIPSLLTRPLLSVCRCASVR